MLRLLPACAGQPAGMPVRVGADQLERYLPLLRGKQVGLVVNHSSLVGATHLADTLQASGICLFRIFAPEHGFRGDAPDGEHIADGMDQQTATPIVSLYGSRRRPNAEDLAGVDIVVFDIQDVGVRFYTYISTLYYLLEACAQYSIQMLVLDRPNPNGHYVDGPVLDMRLQSFVGIVPLPVVHGCTVGELARLFTGEYWTGPVRPQLTVIPCLNYTHQTPYELPVPPSPNLPNQRAVLLYPSLCFFEGTAASIGRGTEWPFQVVGHPDFPDTSAFSFRPIPNAASKYPPLEGRLCRGYDYRSLSVDSLYRQARIDLTPLLDFYCEFPNKPEFFLASRYFNRLSGTFSLWPQVEEGNFESDIRATWQEDLRFFRAIREKYLLYPDY
ncbi:MAG: DUF1343 domain-containing protein [Saprospirales bacterium]|nr:DUF1343 domain-containing protein [Saprospirales bacterium]MBK8920020.1 DUF1343 domain-containing protein [Saprospirales bacterium]